MGTIKKMTHDGTHEGDKVGDWNAFRQSYEDIFRKKSKKRKKDLKGVSLDNKKENTDDKIAAEE